MTDIVEQLRHSADMAAEDGIPSTLLKEAADEIERLRAALQELTTKKHGFAFQAFARAALIVEKMQLEGSSQVAAAIRSLKEKS